MGAPLAVATLHILSHYFFPPFFLLFSMLKFEDRIRGHKFYFKAATGAIEASFLQNPPPFLFSFLTAFLSRFQTYLALLDKPQSSDNAAAELGLLSLFYSSLFSCR